MSDPASQRLPHRGPALVVHEIQHVGEREVRCSRPGGRRLHWAELVDGCAQAAGILVRSRTPGATRALVSAYESIDVRLDVWEEEVRWVGRFLRRVGDLHQVEVEAYGPAGEQLASVRLALHLLAS